MNSITQPRARRLYLRQLGVKMNPNPSSRKKRYHSGVEVFFFPVNYCEYHQYNRVLRFLTRGDPLKKDDLGSPRGFGIK